MAIKDMIDKVAATDARALITGGNGAGQTTKLCNQIAVSVNNLAMALIGRVRQLLFLGIFIRILEIEIYSKPIIL